MNGPTADGDSSAPVDRSVLIRIFDRVKTNSQVARAYITAQDKTCLLVEFDPDYYPADVSDAYLNIQWHRNDDFKIHYHETWPDGSWDCRWDRHPNTHNTDEHFHPPPDAPTHGEDESYPANLHDVMRLVEDEVNTRIRSLWEDVS